jgi:hypothetical protein
LSESFININVAAELKYKTMEKQLLEDAISYYESPVGFAADLNKMVNKCDVNRHPKYSFVLNARDLST